MTGMTKNRMDNIGDKAKDTAHEIGKEAKDLASTVADKARDATKVVADKAGDAADFVGEKADAVADRAGDGLKNLAGKVRDNTPDHGIVGKAADKVADGIEQTGKYLKDEGFTGMGKDMLELIKNNPIPALLIGVGLGYLLARATRS